MPVNRTTRVNGHEPRLVRAPKISQRENELVQQLARQVEQLDVAELSRRQIEDQLAEAQQVIERQAAQLHTAREEERAYLARELHDQLGQLLAAVKIYVTTLSRTLTVEQ